MWWKTKERTVQNCQSRWFSVPLGCGQIQFVSTAASWLHPLRRERLFGWSALTDSQASLNHKRHFLKWSVTRSRWLLNYFEGMSRVSAIIAVKLWDVRMPNAICTNRYLLWHRLVGVVTILCEDLFLSVKRNVRSRCRLLASSFIERLHEHWCKM